MGRLLKRIDAALKWAGHGMGRVWLSLLGIAILCSFPLAGIALSLGMGWWATKWIGGGAWSLLLTAYVFGLFLSIYVWAPLVRPTTLKLTDLLVRETPK
jgi:hypothetical protein